MGKVVEAKVVKAKRCRVQSSVCTQHSSDHGKSGLESSRCVLTKQTPGVTCFHPKEGVLSSPHKDVL